MSFTLRDLGEGILGHAGWARARQEHVRYSVAARAIDERESASAPLLVRKRRRATFVYLNQTNLVKQPLIDSSVACISSL